MSKSSNFTVSLDALFTSFSCVYSFNTYVLQVGLKYTSTSI